MRKAGSDGVARKVMWSAMWGKSSGDARIQCVHVQAESRERHQHSPLPSRLNRIVLLMRTNLGCLHLIV